MAKTVCVETRWWLTLGVMVATALFLGLVASGVLSLNVMGQHGFAGGPFMTGAVTVLPAACVVLLVGVLWWCLAGRNGGRGHWLVVAAVSCAFVCALTVRSGGHGGFAFQVAAMLCDGSNGYFVTAVETPNTLGLAREYPARMPHLRLHCQTQSPGAILLHDVLRRFVRRCRPVLAFGDSLLACLPGIEPDQMAFAVNDLWGLKLTGRDVSEAMATGILFSLVGALGAVPVFALARQVAGRRPALVATALYAVTPSLMWYSPAVDQLYPTLATCVALLIAMGFRKRSNWQYMAAGLLSGVGMFLNLGVALMAIIGGLMVVFGGLWERGVGRPWLRDSLWRLGLMGGEVLVVLAVVRWGLGIPYLEILRVSTALRMWQYRELFPRPWLTWVLLNPVEYAIGLGFSSLAVILAALALWRRLNPGGRVLLGAALVALIALDVSGGMRAEGSRLLLFTMPIALVGAAPALRRLELTRGAAPALLVLAQGLYAVIGCQLFEVWGVWATAFR